MKSSVQILKLQDVDGSHLRLPFSHARLHAAGGTIHQDRIRKTRYVHFARCRLVADDRVFRLAEGFASIHREGINAVTAAYEEVFQKIRHRHRRE